jgi:hypothetical protein
VKLNNSKAAWIRKKAATNIYRKNDKKIDKMANIKPQFARNYAFTAHDFDDFDRFYAFTAHDFDDFARNYAFTAHDFDDFARNYAFTAHVFDDSDRIYVFTAHDFDDFARNYINTTILQNKILQFQLLIILKKVL